MVKMFSTFFDHTLQLLSLVEKNPRLFRDRNLRRYYEAELRFLRMFLLCFPRCDANLLDDLIFIAASISVMFTFDGMGSFTLSNTDYDSLHTKVEDKIQRCHAEINKYLTSCSFEAEGFSSKETLEFLDSVLVNVNDLLEYQPDEVDTLEETVFLLRNLVYYTPMGGGTYDISFLSLTDSDANFSFQFNNVHDLANEAACLSLLHWINKKEDVETGELIRRLQIDLQQKLNPRNPEFIKLCLEVIQVPKMKHADRLLFGEFVSRFVDFFLENLVLILNDDVRMVREGLILLITFLADPPANTVNHYELSSIRKKIYAVLDQASDTICFFGATKMDLVRGKTIVDDVVMSIVEVRWKIESLCVQIHHSSWSNFPRIDRLGYFECLLEYLQNLKETMNNNKKLVPFLQTQIITIQEELLPLRMFLQDTSMMQIEHNGLKDIWEQITSLLYDTDFAIKSAFFIDEAIWYNLTCLSFVIRKIKDIRFKFVNIGLETQTKGSHNCKTEVILPLMNSIDVPKPTTSTSTVQVLVGFKKERELLLDRLECGSAKLDIVSIVGMGGIGKTTLAIKLFNKPSVVNRFHKRAFGSVSQAYRKRNVLLDILSDISVIDDDQMSDEDLQHRLYQCLKGNRYLVVLDDIWDMSVWNDLKPSFPDDSNGSRVIFTTRINSISISTSCQLPFLSSDESWEMLQQYIFHKDPCPPHLSEVGKLIAVNCKGLPLAIVVIAGFLARTERSLLKWNEVAHTLGSLASSEGCKDIIKLSYNQLPEALKSCFLYLGAFREDEIIESKKLALLWIAEGFVLKSGSTCLHKIAEKYLNDLGDRNLITVTERSYNGGIKRCRVHDLIRDFCITEAQEEHYMCFVNEPNKSLMMSSVIYQYRININIEIEAECRSFVDTKPKGPTVHSLLFQGSKDYINIEMKSLQSFLQNFKLVQVLDLRRLPKVPKFLKTITALIHLRYLALLFSQDLYIPPDISNLWSLETLVLSATFFVKFPSDIWKMKRLRCVEAEYIAYVALDGATGVFSLLPDLNFFSRLYIPPGEDGEELLRRLSNVRKFSCICKGWWDPHRECNQLPKLEILAKLESLKMVHKGVAQPPFMFNFPTTIRELTLEGFKLHWNEFSVIIGMLPRLEVLVLDFDSFIGKRWNAEDEEFPNIKSLTLEGLHIEEWDASIDSFPSLEKLVVRRCFNLVEIPPCFSEVATLRYIEVHHCKRSVADSAIQVQKDQFDSGNESFEVDIFAAKP